MTKGIQLGGGVLALVLAVLVPALGQRFVTSLLTEVYIFAIVAMSLGLLIGYAGLASFGHAAFFAVGAYAAGLVAKNVGADLLLTALSAVIASGVIAGVVGYFSVRSGGVTFIMLTLAFAQMIHAGAIKWDGITGGFDGLTGIPRPLVLGTRLDTQGMYWLSLVALAAIYLLLRQVVTSPFGHSLIGIRQNQRRMSALGVDVRLYQLAVFVLAGTIAGFGGGLFAHHNGFVSPDQAHWFVSGSLMLMVIVGGGGTLTGPVLGAVVVVLLQNVMSSYTDRWQMLMGALFIVVVLGAQGGLVRLYPRMQARFSRAIAR